MKLLRVILKRQLVSYLSAPVTYLSTAVFLIASTALGLHTSQLVEQSSADLHGFFQLHPWTYLLLTPVLCAQLWTDEYKTGAIGFLRTLPISNFEIVMGKYLAAWIIAGIALLMTFPLVITVNYLGNPDNSVIASQYLASWLLAGSYLSAGCFISTLTHHRTAIFTATLGLLVIVSGLSSIIDALEYQAPVWLIDRILSLSPSVRFDAIDHGVLALHDSLYFASVIIAFLATTTITLNIRNS
ncbi:ABC transporter permease subunit [Pseudomonas sp. Bout1]|uniref:ABC transporter permease n=1 Tax=Pseudomonas sp. Bout1 TaxID=3048600 RepID=UPI002AB3F91A|nr:ABC transporter permease subunit [Pseudomonas sp. Bout1]MDY7531940.1 ABC transporter permease subunit [Pseudomonas sp. Bout1]MEB0185010.1 ABC transporter permease subunit [Pseudomonas sp. Bout1]